MEVSSQGAGVGRSGEGGGCKTTKKQHWGAGVASMMGSLPGFQTSWKAGGGEWVVEDQDVADSS